MNFWDKLSKNYQKSVLEDKNGDYAYEKQVNTPSILSLCDNGNLALDLGCGDGRFTKALESEYRHVYAIDYSLDLIKLAKGLCKKTKFIRHDLEHPFPKFSEKFDLIVGKLLLMYIKDIDNIAMECCKNLKDGGKLVFSVTHPLKWISESNKGNISNKLYKGYLSETTVSGNIAQDKELEVQFVTRTLQTYINTFTKHGFTLNTVLETGVPDTFVIKYPQYLSLQNKPFRLNIRFTKK